jgi:RND superfamily putative drug exporter
VATGTRCTADERRSDRRRAECFCIARFAALASSPQVSLKMFATGLAAGILLDATVVRALLLPALVSLLGERSWWVPRRRAQPIEGAPPQRCNRDREPTPTTPSWCRT